MLTPRCLLGAGYLLLALSSPAPALPPQARPGTDRQGDPLPAGASSRFGSVRWLHGPGASRVVFAPVGQLVASFGSGNVLTLHDTTTGRTRHRLPAEAWIESAVFSPDGKLLA